MAALARAITTALKSGALARISVAPNPSSVNAQPAAARATAASVAIPTSRHADPVNAEPPTWPTTPPYADEPSAAAAS